MLPKSAEAEVSKPNSSGSDNAVNMSDKAASTSDASSTSDGVASISSSSSGRGARAKGRTSREGLSATVAAAASLLEEGDLAHAGIATDARDLLLDEIEPDALQPRRHFDAAELEALAEDIGRRGVLQPILVRPPRQPGQPYRLVAGERRWRAARLAGKVRIPARIRNLTDDEVQAAQLAENVLRAELTDIEKGRALRRLYELRKASNYKTTWEDIASEVGLGRSRIHDLFHLAGLPEVVAGMIEAGRLSGSHGILLQRANDLLGPDEIVLLAEQSARPDNRRTGGYLMSVAQLRQTIQLRQTAAEQAALEAVSEEHVTFSTSSDGASTIEGSETAAPGEESRSSENKTAASPAPLNSPLLHTGRFMRPAVRQVIEGLDQNALSEVEIAALFMALERVRTSRQLGGLSINPKAAPVIGKPNGRRKVKSG